MHNQERISTSDTRTLGTFVRKRGSIDRDRASLVVLGRTGRIGIVSSCPPIRR